MDSVEVDKAFDALIYDNQVSVAQEAWGGAVEWAPNVYCLVTNGNQDRIEEGLSWIADRVYAGREKIYFQVLSSKDVGNGRWLTTVIFPVDDEGDNNV